ncbi:MAG TPA: hypothetical protein VMB50_02165 [Myxococcales bacterium]|nr:hypothetical protein [Myxococcales bacterium]
MRLLVAACVALAVPRVALAQWADADEGQPLPPDAPPAPDQSPPPPPADVPPPPGPDPTASVAPSSGDDSAEAPDTDSAEAPPDGVPGDWVYTEDQGWIWAPQGDAYASPPAPQPDAQPYVFVFIPLTGYRWIVAPWYFAGWWPFGYVWAGASYPRGYVYPWYRQAKSQPVASRSSGSWSSLARIPRGSGRSGGGNGRHR